MRYLNADMDDCSGQPRTVEPVRSNRIDEARRKLAAGEYDRPEVIDAVVERLLTSLTEH
jgi:hypothetical protein